MKKHVLILMCLVLWSSVHAHAVIFANDCIKLFKGNTPVEGLRVIVESNEGLKMPEAGNYCFRQGTDQQKLKFYLISGKALYEKQEYEYMADGLKDFGKHEPYLNSRLKDTESIISTIIPAPTDRKTHNSPSKGMTGGQIGKQRIFHLDLNSGKLKQVQ